MVEKILHQVKEHRALEIQFRLGQKTIVKDKKEWIELDSEGLSLSDWEDLKDLCLQNSEKLTLETKGFVRGIYRSSDQNWTFSFSEHKECIKAYFMAVPQFNLSSTIQFQPYWQKMKAQSGLHFIVSQRGQGKSSLLKDLVSEMRKDSPQLVAIHGAFSTLSLTTDDSVIHLGTDSVSWDNQHPIYDGVDQFVIDMNSIQHLEKWIRFAEEGRSVYISLSGLSIANAIEHIHSVLQNNQSLKMRFIDVLSTICYQRLIGIKEGAAHEVLVPTSDMKNEIFNTNDRQSVFSLDKYKNCYQSLNQSLLQALIRRRIDVKTAFQFSNDPENLDQQLKKMGL